MLFNFQDFRNAWVSIHPATGLITSSPIGEFPGDMDAGGTTLVDESLEVTSVPESRVLTLQSQALSGR